MKRKNFSPCFWKYISLGLVLVCLAGINFQGGTVSARQEGEITVEPTTEGIETPAPEETPLPDTDITTPSETPLTETATPEATGTAEIPSAAPSESAENSITPEVTEQTVVTLSGKYEPDEILVRFRKSASEANLAQCLNTADAEAISIIEELDVWVVLIPNGRVAESIATISACPQVRYVEPNYMAAATDTIPTDFFWNQQYGLVKIRAPQGWDYSTGSASVTIAILDTGVDLAHPDLITKIVPGYDFINDDATPQDDNFQSHGTHVAGISAASSNNGVGVTGVSWGARIMPVKVLGPLGIGPLSDVAEGIVWATNQGAQVINLSLGSNSDSQALQDAVNYANQRGVILVAAAGNNSGAILYPALYPNVIAVGAVDSNNNRVSNSNTGEALDLVAPGSLIYSTIRNGYGYNSGTSMAAPFVSGLAAVLYGMPGNGSSALVTSQMKSTAKDLGAAGFDYEYGFGLIQMDSALRQALSISSPEERENPPYLFAMPTVPTFDLNSTDTLTPSQVTATPTFTQTPTSIPPTNTTTPTVPPSPTRIEPQARALSLTGWQLPCAGSAFVLAGLLLLWMARKKDRRRR